MGPVKRDYKILPHMKGGCVGPTNLPSQEFIVSKQIVEMISIRV